MVGLSFMGWIMGLSTRNRQGGSSEGQTFSDMRKLDYFILEGQLTHYLNVTKPTNIILKVQVFTLY
jgi:hypothetical protein